MSILWLTFIIAIGAGIATFFLQMIHKRIGWFIFLLYAAWQMTVVVLIFTGKVDVSGDMVLRFSIGDMRPVEFYFVYREIGFIFFAGSTLVTFFIALFSFSYNDKQHATAIAPLWILLMGASLGIFFSADWIMFLVSWELMGWTSFFIISQGKARAAKAGLYYMVLSLIGTATLIISVLLINNVTGSRYISIINQMHVLWESRPAVMVAVTVLFTVTFFAKSAVIPFYMWPAKAHAEAPDDFSAFLSAIMIKYGVFGMIAIVLPLFRGYIGISIAGVPLMLFITGWIGAITAVIGTLYAIAQNDMKKLMAYSTVGNIGFIIAALSVNSPVGIAAALFHTFNHMLFKSGIFLSMASVKYRTGERNMHKLGGMAYNMPITFFTFLLCIISAAGIPPMGGFGSKWLVFQALFEKRFLFMTIPLFFASTAAFMYLFRGLHTIYLGQRSPRFAKIKEAPPLQIIAQSVLMLLVFLVGLLPGLVLNPINRAINEMGMQSIKSDMFGIVGNTSTLNITVAGLVFIGAFCIVMILFLIGKKRQVIKDPLDRYTSAEPPEEWGLTPEKYHFGYNFYDYFTDMVNPILNALSIDRLFKRIAYEVERFSGVLRRFFTHPLSSTIFVVLSFILLFCVGWFAL